MYRNWRRYIDRRFVDRNRRRKWFFVYRNWWGFVYWDWWRKRLLVDWREYWVMMVEAFPWGKWWKLRQRMVEAFQWGKWWKLRQWMVPLGQWRVLKVRPKEG